MKWRERVKGRSMKTSTNEIKRKIKHKDGKSERKEDEEGKIYKKSKVK